MSRFTVSGITGMATLALCYFVFLPMERSRLSHINNLKLAELCEKHAKQFLDSDREFANVTVGAFTGANGSLLFYGHVPSEEAKIRLETHALAQEYPVEVVLRVELAPVSPNNSANPKDSF